MSINGVEQSPKYNSLQRVNELARLNRIATVSELSASIAHELKQPLASIVASGSAAPALACHTRSPDLDEVRATLTKNRSMKVIVPVW